MMTTLTYLTSIHILLSLVIAELWLPNKKELLIVVQVIEIFLEF